MLNRLVSRCFDWMKGLSAGTETATRAGEQGGTDAGEGATDETAEEETGGRSLAPDGTADGVRATDGGTDSPGAWQDLLSGETVSKQEVQVELGLQPHEFLAWLVRSSGGRMWQADVVETTGWSKSTVSRYLDTLESNGIVERVRIGRRKLVGLPEQMPTGARESEGPSEGISTDAVSWTDEAV